MRFRNQAKDGNYYWVDTTIVPFLDEGRKPLQYLAIRTDITDRKQAEEEIDRFFSLSIDMLCIASMDGFFKRLNPAFEITLGYTLEELKERPFLDFIYPEDVPATLAEIEKLGTGQPTIAFENRYRCKDGSYKWLSWVCMPFPAEGLLYAAARDITEQKQTEQELREFATQLQRSNRELKNFAYIVSHDLQEPLRKMKSFSQLLARECQDQFTDNEQAHRYLDYIIDAADRQRTMIQALLNYSRLARNDSSKVSVDLNVVVEKVLEDLSIAIAETEAIVTVNSLPTVQASPTQMTQLFLNLIGNGIKFKGDTTPRIQIEAQLQQSEWLISVRDNGIGIKPRYTERIFQIFQRLHSRSEYPGTGIGLAICRKIVEGHGGHIWVSSESGQGSTFYFTHPVSPSPG